MRTTEVRTHSGLRALFLGAALLMLGVAPALAQESFRATHIARLDGFSEVPAIDTATATGIAIMRLDTVARTLEYRISVSDIQNVTAAHFHFSRPDTVGPVIHTITLGPDFATNRTVTGIWTDVDTNTLRRLSRGTVYINFHTTDHPAGLIRGHVDRIPNLIADLTPEQESPAVRVPSNGSGDALILLDRAARRLDYLLTWYDLTGRATAAHFHTGAKGVAGPVVKAITLAPLDGRTFGTWSNISEEDMTLLLTRGIYVNIHTDSNTSGEIRGQVLPIEFYTAAISPQNEPNRPTNSQSAGTGFVQIISEIDAVSDLYGEFVVDGTTGPISGAHIHVAPVGASGGIIRTLEPFDPVTGTFWSVPFFDGFIDQDSLSIFRNSNTYVNFHTPQWSAGELRGQLIPSAHNLEVGTSSVVVEQSVATGGALTASVERTGGAISFRIGSGVRGSSRTIALYSSIGTRISEITVEGYVARIGSDDLASGLYFAQLVVDGRPAAICRVMITK